ncbi:MAG: type II toxin-antitoxin system Phd/YefM family antitoxin [Gemmatimonadetes bacterium]|nr:type II toxin-antitoxin system Phd/YefM family antitoxin [Gemmatimonadota bacterium]
MRVVGIKTLKNKLSEYVRLAAGGERILVTDRDRVVAELGPPAEGRAERVADARLAEAVRKGWIAPPVLPQSYIPPSKPVMSFEEVMADLEASRADRDLP